MIQELPMAKSFISLCRLVEQHSQTCKDRTNLLEIMRATGNDLQKAKELEQKPQFLVAFGELTDRATEQEHYGYAVYTRIGETAGETIFLIVSDDEITDWRTYQPDTIQRSYHINQ